MITKNRVACEEAPGEPSTAPIATLVLLFRARGMFFLFFLLFFFSSSPGACLQAKNRVMVWSLDQVNGIIKDTSAETRKIRINKITTFSFPFDSRNLNPKRIPSSKLLFFFLGSQGLQEKLL